MLDLPVKKKTSAQLAGLSLPACLCAISLLSSMLHMCLLALLCLPGYARETLPSFAVFAWLCNLGTSDFDKIS